MSGNDDEDAVGRPAGYLIDVENAAAELDQSGWFPIETAPRDGSCVLLWMAPRKNGGGRQAWGNLPIFDDYRIAMWVSNPNSGAPCWRVMNNGYGWSQDWSFTHWMPLPNPPVSP